jgi:phospholipase C
MMQSAAPVRLLWRVLPAVVLLLGIAPLMKAAEKTATPLEHLVVIFQENVSFDHYFGTYPRGHEPER